MTTPSEKALGRCDGTTNKTYGHEYAGLHPYRDTCINWRPEPSEKTRQRACEVVHPGIGHYEAFANDLITEKVCTRVAAELEADWEGGVSHGAKARQRACELAREINHPAGSEGTQYICGGCQQCRRTEALIAAELEAARDEGRAIRDAELQTFMRMQTEGYERAIHETRAQARDEQNERWMLALTHDGIGVAMNKGDVETAAKDFIECVSTEARDETWEEALDLLSDPGVLDEDGIITLQNVAAALRARKGKP